MKNNGDYLCLRQPALCDNAALTLPSWRTRSGESLAGFLSSLSAWPGLFLFILPSATWGSRKFWASPGEIMLASGRNWSVFFSFTLLVQPTGKSEIWQCSGVSRSPACGFRLPSAASTNITLAAMACSPNILPTVTSPPTFPAAVPYWATFELRNDPFSQSLHLRGHCSGNYYIFPLTQVCSGEADTRTYDSTLLSILLWGHSLTGLVCKSWACKMLSGWQESKLIL